MIIVLYPEEEIYWGEHQKEWEHPREIETERDRQRTEVRASVCFLRCLFSILWLETLDRSCIIEQGRDTSNHQKHKPQNRHAANIITGARVAMAIA